MSSHPLHHVHDEGGGDEADPSSASQADRRCVARDPQLDAQEVDRGGPPPSSLCEGENRAHVCHRLPAKCASQLREGFGHPKPSHQLPPCKNALTHSEAMADSEPGDGREGGVYRISGVRPLRELTCDTRRRSPPPTPSGIRPARDRRTLRAALGAFGKVRLLLVSSSVGAHDAERVNNVSAASSHQEQPPWRSFTSSA